MSCASGRVRSSGASGRIRRVVRELAKVCRASAERREATVEFYRPLTISEDNGKKFVAFVGWLLFHRPTLQYIHLACSASDP